MVAGFFRLSLLVWLSGGVAVVHAGLAEPGTVDYWVWLNSISSTHGTFSPLFSSKVSEYNLTIDEVGLTELALDLVLDVSKYSLMTMAGGLPSEPHIFIDGKQVDYNPMEPVRSTVSLPRTYAPVVQTVRIRLVDPADESGGLFGTGLFASAPKQFEYVIHIRKIPEFQNCVRATGMSVRDNLGRQVMPSPRFDPHVSASGNEYKFVLPRDTAMATVQVACPQIDGGGSSQLYDETSVTPGANFTVDMSSSLLQRVFVTCEYSNHEWAYGNTKHIYIVDLDKHLEGTEVRAVEAQLAPLQNYGYCETVSAHDERLKEKPARNVASLLSVAGKKGFVCRVDREEAVFVATYSSAINSMVRSSLVDAQSPRRTPMPNAMPTTLHISRERRYFDLHVEAGDVAIDYPVLMLWPASCSTLQCPPLQALRGGSTEVAKEHMCSGEICTLEDQPHCCGPRATCESFGSGCPAHQEVRPDGAQVLCEGTVCSKIDEETCCAWITTTTATTTTVTSTSTTITSSSTQTRTSTTVTSTTVTSTTVTETTQTSTNETVINRHSSSSSSSSSSTTSSSTSSSASSTTSRTTGTYTGTRTGTTTTSTTMTSTTSTSTSMFCIEQDVVWTPLDLPNTLPTVEHDRDACQDRCSRNPWCRHWAFWTAGRHCHLQGENATRNEYGFGFDSGPPECLPSLTITSTTSFPNNLKCVKEGLSWEPMLGTPGYYTGTAEENTQLCQERCARFAGCAHFVLDTVTGMCKLADYRASLVVAPVAWVMGPPRCQDTVYEEMHDFILRKHEKPPAANMRGGKMQSLGPADAARKISQLAVFGACLAVAAVVGSLGMSMASSRWRVGRRNWSRRIPAGAPGAYTELPRAGLLAMGPGE